jgi:hypothetical protein
MLKLLGLDELIAADRDDYLRIVARLAADGPERERLSARIRERKTGLYRDQSVVDALAEFLRGVENPALAE